MDFQFLQETFLQLLAVFPVTIALFVAAVSIGGLLALILLWMRMHANPVLSSIAQGYIFVFRGSPLLMQMFLIYYGLGQFGIIRHSVLWPVLRDPFNCAAISLALCTAAYTAEVFRGGVKSVPLKEVEAARAYGMSGFLLWRRIIAPAAFRQCLPAYSTELVSMVKATSLASLVTVWEVTGIANKIISSTYRTFEVFLCAALIYLVANFVLIKILNTLESSLMPQRRDPRPTTAKPVRPEA
ncbi:ABC transporter permease [Rhizobium binxianense]|uniref:ABC transporter permease n=1 Tax=Rhizobium binxianense TaxID=3024242 RepID=UPI0023626E3E|nr:ABC transporter permease subunit [Rhizobium sp. MJ37]MDC9837818.1 ABC transporter permease subunit [Rhizobium sp. MJ37]